MKLLFCALAVVISACGPQVYRPGEPVALKLDSCIESALDGRIAQDVHAGAHIWDSLGGTFDVASASTAIDVVCGGSGATVCTTDEFVGEWTGQVVLNTCLWTEPHGDGVVFDQAIESTVGHELGHAMGMVHEQDLYALMYKATNGIATTDASDATQLCALYPGDSATCVH